MQMALSFRRYFHCWILFLAIWLGGFCNKLQSQNPRKQINFVQPKSFPGRLSLIRELKQVKDSASLEHFKLNAYRNFESRGYAEFTIDSLIRSGNSTRCDLHLGPRYFLRNLEAVNLSEQAARKTNFYPDQNKLRPYSRFATEKKISKTLDYFQNDGYPFARMDSLNASFERSGDTVFADLSWTFDPGERVVFDSVIVIGKIRESNNFIYSLTGIRLGDPYSQEKIREAQRLLNNSIYFRNAKPAVVAFGDEGARVTLELEPRKAGRFDILLGILPPLQNEPNKIRFTGLVDLQLISPVFKSGEILRLRYDKLLGTSQKMMLTYKHPYLAGTPLSAEFELNILKQDTLFFTRYFQFSGGYQVNPFLSIRAWYRNRSSTLLSTKAFEADTTKIPPVLDARDNLYGIGFTFDNLDYHLSPTRGFFIRAGAGIGLKNIRKNPKLAESLYSTVQPRVPRQETDLEIHWYRRTFKRQVVHLGNHTYWLRQSEYFTNDLALTGGAQSIRGFNENQFYANLFTVFTAEYRYLLEQNSFLFVFGDFGYLETPNGTPSSTWPSGLGFGMSYETKAGMVSVTYAVGRTGEIPFQPARGRIHVGLINQF